MAGRNAKSIALHLAEGNPNNLTKEQIAERKAAEIKLGRTDYSRLRAPATIRNDKAAMAHWKSLLKEYKAAAEQGVDLLTSSDVGLLALYCKTYSEYERLQDAYSRLDSIVDDLSGLEQYMEDQTEFDTKARQNISQLLRIDGILRIETAINKKMDMLIKMQDRLFLNPLAKVKNVPKPKKDDKPVGKFAKFAGGKGG